MSDPQSLQDIIRSVLQPIQQQDPNAPQPNFRTTTTPTAEQWLQVALEDDPFRLDKAVNLANPTRPEVDWQAVAALAIRNGRRQQQEARLRDIAATMALRAGVPMAAGVLGAVAGPVGAIAGAATGGALGEDLAQQYELSHGLRAEANPVQVATQGALSALPGAMLTPTKAVVRQLPKAIGSAAGLSGVSSAGTQLAETGSIDPQQLLTETAIGTVAGTAIGTGALAASRAARNPAVRQAVKNVLDDERGSINIGPPETRPIVQRPEANTGTAVRPADPVLSATKTDVPEVNGNGPLTVADSSESGEWSRIAGDRLPREARGALDTPEGFNFIPDDTNTTPKGNTPARQKMDLERIERFVGRHEGIDDDTREAILSTWQSGDDYLFETQRRTGMTFEQLDALASEIVPRVKLPKGSVVSPEEMAAMRRSAFGLAQKASDITTDWKTWQGLQSAIAAGDQTAIEQAGELATKWNVNGEAGWKVARKIAAEQWVAAQRSLAGVRSEYGRGLNYLKSVQHARKMDDAAFLEKALKGGAVPEQALDALAVLPDQTAKYKFLRSLAKPNAQDYWRWYAISSYLSGPATQVRNAAGNMANFGVESVLSVPGSAIDRMVNPNNRQVVLSEQQAALAGITSGFLDGVHKAKYFFRHGFSQADADALVELPPEVFGGALLPNLVGRTMGAVDQFFRTVGFSMEVHRAATAQAWREGLRGADLAARVTQLVDDPTITPELHKRALRYAAGLTYQDGQGAVTGPFVKGVKGAMRGLDNMTQSAADRAWDAGLSKLGKLGSVAYGAMAFPPSVVVAPFISTPFNILKRAVEYSPAGAVRVVQRDRDAILGAARSAVGTAMMAGAYGLYTQDRITGAPPKDESLRDAFYAEGKRPYAVKIGEQWVPYQHLGQFGMLLGAVANYGQATDDNPADAPSAFGQLMGATGRMLVDATFLKGMSGVLDMISNPDRGGRWWQNTVTGLLPASAAMRAIRNEVDPVLRDPETMGEAIRASLPGLSKTVEPRVDFTGQEVQRSNAILPTRAVDAPLQKELARLKIATDQGYLRDPNDAAERLTAKINTRLTRVGHPAITVDRPTLTKYAKAHGRISADVLGNLIQTAAYRELSDDEKRKLVERAKDQITEQVDARFAEQYLQGIGQ